MSSSSGVCATKVLLVGTIRWAKKELERLSQKYTIENIQSKSREQFIDDCRHKYASISVIYRAFNDNIVGPFDRELVQHLPKSVRYICSQGAGYDHIDVNACLERNIRVSNTPNVVDAATADIAMTLVLNTCRQIPQYMRSLQQGQFGLDVPLATDIEDKTVGIIGMGGIGRAIAKRLKGFDVSIQYHNRRRLDPTIEKQYDAAYVDWDILLATSDIIFVCVPLNETTHHLLSDKEFSKMKDGVIIINIARGAVIDEKAMVRALANGKVWAVGLDVFEKEPEIHPGLISHPRSVLLPHVGTNTVETDEKIELLALKNLESALDHQRLLTPVPEHVTPNVSLE